jgi:hypothetical protein
MQLLRKKHPELQERVMLYCLSKGDLALWLDLRATLNGAAVKFDVFYKVAGDAIEEIGGATANRHGTDMISSSHSHLISIPSLYEHIMQKMNASDDEAVRLAPRPLQQLLAVSMCPQHSSREVSKHCTGRFKIERCCNKEFYGHAT